MNYFKSPSFTNVDSFSLEFHNEKIKTSWIINIWSNQVISGIVIENAEIVYNEGYPIEEWESPLCNNL